jgi:hypothetical protein
MDFDALANAEDEAGECVAALQHRYFTAKPIESKVSPGIFAKLSVLPPSR